MDLIAILVAVAIFGAVCTALYFTLRKKYTGKGPDGSQALEQGADAIGEAAKPVVDAVKDAAQDAADFAKDQAKKL